MAGSKKTGGSSKRDGPGTVLIKGYLPVRLKLPPINHNYRDETFFYVKEHQDTNSSGKTSDRSSGHTLFVANAPTVPNIRTKLLLKSLFGRFGDVTRVTVIPNPRRDPKDNTNLDCSPLLWTEKFPVSTFRPRQFDPDGEFAHVNFSSQKEMKKVMRELNKIMNQTQGKVHTEDEGLLPSLTLDPIETQTLADETDRQLREEERKKLSEYGLLEENHTGDENEFANRGENQQGLRYVMNQHLQTCRRFTREFLLAECNRVVQEYEDAEEEAKLAREAAKNQPDEDGFVTVTYSTAVGSKRDLEADALVDVASQQRKRQKRSRKKKESVGTTQLSDFYRFQTKDNRKKSLQDLRERFEEDLARVKKMKEENKYKPF